MEDAPADITLIDRTNHHLFQPLLYQVATGVLSAGQVAPALRAMFRRQKNVRVLLGRVTEIDLERRIVTMIADKTNEIPYDTLIVATGATHSYFGHEEWERIAPGMKTLDDAAGCAAASSARSRSPSSSRPSRAPGVADVCGRRRRAHRRRARRPDRAAGPSRAPRRVPGDRSQQGPGAAVRRDPERARRIPAEPQQARREGPAPSRRRRRAQRAGHRDRRRRADDRLRRRAAAHPRQDSDLGGGRDRVRARQGARPRQRRGAGQGRADPCRA